MPPQILGSISAKISDSIIQQIALIVKPPETSEVSSIYLRNKEEGEVHGNWGKFHPIDYSITVCVPTIDLRGYTSLRKHTRTTFKCENKFQWLALVIGHEYYHAWQWCHEKELWHCKEYLEVGAERYEEVALDKWNKYLEDSGVYEAVARRG